MILEEDLDLTMPPTKRVRKVSSGDDDDEDYRRRRDRNNEVNMGGLITPQSYGKFHSVLHNINC